MMHPGNAGRGKRMERRGRWGGRCWRALGPAALLISLAVPQVAAERPLAVQAMTAGTARPELSTFAGQPATGKPAEVAQQPFGLAVSGRCTFVADPTNRVVRLLIDNGELVFAGAGALAVEGDGGDLSKAQLAGPYAVAIGQVRQPAYQVTDFDVYIADTFGDQVRKVSVTVPPIGSPSAVKTAVISTIAGTGAFGFQGDNGPATAAQLNSPYGVAWDPNRNAVYVADTLNNRVRVISSSGTIATLLAAPLNHPRALAVNGDALYIADTYNNVVRRLDLTRGALTTVAGTGTAGAVDGVKGNAAQLRLPSGIAFDPKGNLYIADTGNNEVRELSATDNVLRRVAGSGKAGEFGDGGPAILAQLASPMGVAVRPNGDVVIADTGNNLVRVLEGTLSSTPAHNIHVEAGNGTASFAGNGQPPIRAQFAAPAAVVSQLNSGSPLNAAVPAVTGQRYVVDTFNHTVRTFGTSDNDPDHHTTGLDVNDVTTLAGIGGARGPAAPSSVARPLADTRLAYPMGAALDTERHLLYIADTFNNVVRAIDLTNRTIATVAGTGSSGYASTDEGKLATQVPLSYPTGLAVDAAGNLFIADTYNSRVREVTGGARFDVNGKVTVGSIVTVAGTRRPGYSGDNCDARAAELDFPYCVTLATGKPPKL